MCKGQNNQRQPDFHRKTVEKAGKDRAIKKLEKD